MTSLLKIALMKSLKKERSQMFPTKDFSQEKLQ